MKTSQREPEGDTAPVLTFNIEVHHQISRRTTLEQAGTGNRPRERSAREEGCKSMVHNESPGGKKQLSRSAKRANTLLTFVLRGQPVTAW